MEERPFSTDDIQRLADGKDLSPEVLRALIEPKSPFGPFVHQEDVPLPPELNTGGGVALALGNHWANKRRQERFEERLETTTDPVIVAEGDSWFQHPLVPDIIDHLMSSMNIKCGSAAGDTLGNMVQQKAYLKNMREYNSNVLLFSGGGNDLFAEFPSLLTDNQGAAEGELDAAALDATLERIEAGYRTLIDDLETLQTEQDAASGGNTDRGERVRVLVHTYDAPIPGNRPKTGSFLGQPLNDFRIFDPEKRSGIIRTIVDRFHKLLLELEAQHSMLSVVDLTGKVHQGGWHDEIHPTGFVAKQLASEFSHAIASQ